jgi:hypothetical protein
MTKGTKMFCYGAVVNFGGVLNAEVEALGGVHVK